MNRLHRLFYTWDEENQQDLWACPFCPYAIQISADGTQVQINDFDPQMGHYGSIGGLEIIGYEIIPIQGEVS